MVRREHHLLKALLLQGHIKVEVDDADQEMNQMVKNEPLEARDKHHSVDTPGAKRTEYLENAVSNVQKQVFVKTLRGAFWLTKQWT